MPKYCLDTNVIIYLSTIDSECPRDDRERSFCEQMKQIPMEEFCITGITLAEYHFALSNGSEEYAESNKLRIDFVKNFPRLDFDLNDEDVLSTYGRFKANFVKKKGLEKAQLKAATEESGGVFDGRILQTKSDNDIWIAAIAKVNDCVLVTANKKDFDVFEGLVALFV